ncbi:MAG TPA: CPBP family glutamic-type intramembrane protease [Holophagaceae bacterium]|nr:CPBP family glutamic-type intramembrane protease [Holophagaceae bacterium]
MPALLGYHLLCGMGSLMARPTLAWGQVPRRSWVLIVTLAVGAIALLGTPKLGVLPVAHLEHLRLQWPGGLAGHAVYVLLVNVPLEEAFWRATLAQRYTGWSSLRHGAAFGLHHALGAGLALGWVWALPAFLVTTLAGAYWVHGARREGGLGTALMTHGMADLGLLALAASQLP